MKNIYFLFIFLFIIINNIFGIEQDGLASWYGPKFHGKITANGEIYNQNDLTAAHKTLPFGSIVKVISLENNKYTIVRINDRGPFVENRIIDLSKKAADQLNMLIYGTMKVKIVLLEKGNNKYHKYNNQKYSIQVASFKNKDKAECLLNQLRSEFINVKLNKVNLKQNFYRIIIDNLNYSELQLSRVKLHNKGFDNYLVMKKI